MALSDGSPLTSRPIQYIELDDGIVLKRGCTELRVRGRGMAEVARRILMATTGKTTTCRDICLSFPPHLQTLARDVVEQLVARHMLIAGSPELPSNSLPETHQDIFYWHFGRSADEIGEKLNRVSIAIVGVNYISRQLAKSLIDSNWSNFQVIDFPLLRNLRLFTEAGVLNETMWSLPTPIHHNLWSSHQNDNPPICLVVTSDFGGPTLIQQWNALAVEHKWHCFPIFLKNLVGSIGPLVVPGETACFHCLCSREASHFKDPNLEQIVDECAFSSQPFIGFAPAMTSIVGELAAFELVKFYSGIVPPRIAGSLIEVNLMGPMIKVRRVLKLPRCAVCSPLHKTAPVEIVNQLHTQTNESLT